MKVTIDASCLLINPSSGLYEVLHHLVGSLANISGNKQYELFMNYFRNHISPDTVNYPGVKKKLLRIPRRLIEYWWRYNLPKFDYFYNDIDVYHSLHILIPPTTKTKTVLTVHDCRYLALPELYNPAVVNTYRKQMISSLERTDMVVCDSKFTRQELLKFFDIDERMVKVIHNGYTPYQPDRAKFRQKFNELHAVREIPEDFLLFLGALDPRKNLLKFLNAYALAVHEKKEIPAMVIVGVNRKTWDGSTAARMVEALELKTKIHVFGVLGKDILWDIFSRAKALCYPSLYERFGFPPLEAMSLGVPVLFSNVSSIPEITGDAACLIDPSNIESMAEGLFSIVNDEGYRKTLIELGYGQIKKFSWDRAAEKYDNVYSEAMTA